MIIQIALGIVLAVIILNNFDAIIAFILRAGALVIALIVLVLIGVFISNATNKKEESATTNVPQEQTLPTPPQQSSHTSDNLKSLAASVQAISDKNNSKSEMEAFLNFSNKADYETWLSEMSLRLKNRIHDKSTRLDFLKIVQYESTRAGIDPQVTLAIIDIVSGFKKDAISKDGNIGYMQINPMWKEKIGTKETDLDLTRVNLRYGCTILRYYLDNQSGDLYQALLLFAKDNLKQNDDQAKAFAIKVKETWENNWPYSYDQTTQPSSNSSST